MRINSFIYGKIVVMQYARKLRKGDKVAIKSIDECKNPMCGSHEKVKTELIKGTNFV